MRFFSAVSTPDSVGERDVSGGIPHHTSLSIPPPPLGQRGSEREREGGAKGRGRPRQTPSGEGRVNAGHSTGRASKHKHQRRCPV
eukprot:scaffold1053_cov332-Pavlova_lutheri.AAC.3